MRRGKTLRIIALLACVTLLPLAGGGPAHADLERGCAINGYFLFDTTQNRQGRYHVQLSFAGRCFRQTDPSHDIPIELSIFFVGSARTLGRCTGDQTITGLDLNGTYTYSIDGRPAPFKIFIRYDGTQPSPVWTQQNFANAFVTSRVYGNCPPAGDSSAQLKFIYSRQPASG